MDEREQQRKIKHRLNVLRHAEEVTVNVAQTCRYLGISRPTSYTWCNRYEHDGPDGSAWPVQRTPSHAHATLADVVGKIVHLRSHYHFERRKIDLGVSGPLPRGVVQPFGVYRILKRLAMNRLPASQRHKPHDKWPFPGSVG